MSEAKGTIFFGILSLTLWFLTVKYEVGTVALLAWICTVLTAIFGYLWAANDGLV